MKDRKIIFDISNLVNYLVINNHYTGVERVIVMILNEFVKLKIKNLWICFLHPFGNKYLTFSLDNINFNDWINPTATKKFLKNLGVIGQNKLLKKYYEKPIKYYFHRTRFDIAALVNNHKIFEKNGISIAEWKKNRTRLKLNSYLKILVDIINPDDQLILLDTTWEQNYIEEYKKLKLKKVKIYTFVHDLIPILYPEVTFSGVTTAKYYNWLVQSVDYTTSYVTNSVNTKNDLEKFLSTFQNIHVPIKAIPLVQKNVSIQRKQKIQKDKSVIKLPDALNKIINSNYLCRSVLSEPFVLHVGTIEIRKNIWRLALAWKKLLKEGFTNLPRLVIVGKDGWLNDRFWDLMRGTGNMYGYITIIGNANDEELDLLYKKCLFVAMVSTYEGWGLPVGEALSYGKTAVVADNSALPEVGMDLVEYCDALSVDSIAQAIKKLVFDSEYRRSLELKIKQVKLRDWADVAHDWAKFLNIQP